LEGKSGHILAHPTGGRRRRLFIRRTALVWALMLEQQRRKPSGSGTPQEPLTAFLASVRDVETQTGLDFHPALSKEVQDRVKTVRAERLW